jgi:hypothetical protein
VVRNNRETISEAQVDFITKGPYKEMLNTYTKLDEPRWSELNPLLLKRLKKDDLPLFINFEWYHEQQKFEARLKGV